MKSNLKVALIHYHLRGGGVTRVIENTISALAPTGVEITVLIGEEPAENSDIHSYCKVIEGISYGRDDIKSVDAADIVEELKSKARDSLGTLPDVWHIHNHALGKNIELTRAVIQLAEEGQRFLFQMHDFAEDGRPANYRRYRKYQQGESETDLTPYLYPQADHLHYGVLNGRDYRFFSDAGMEQDRLHLVQNPVFIEEDTSDEASTQEIKDPLFNPDKKLFIYPTRAIRRKNLGEFILWAILSDADQEFAVTLAPKNPEQRKSYNKWTSLSNKYQLPIHFEVGRRWGGTFPQLMRKADGIITTSVAEGFGFCFLEPWLFDQPLYGRDLPLITNDFRQDEVKLPYLYRSLTLPVDWFNRSQLYGRLKAGLKETYEAYGVEISKEKIKEAIELLTRNDRIDFGVLDETAQEQILELLIHRPQLHYQLKPNHLIPESTDDAATVTDHNRQVIQSRFNLQQFRKRLVSLYGTVAASSPSSVEYGLSRPVLNRFLDPEMFTLLRT